MLQCMNVIYLIFILLLFDFRIVEAVILFVLWAIFRTACLGFFMLGCVIRGGWGEWGGWVFIS